MYSVQRRGSSSTSAESMRKKIGFCYQMCGDDIAALEVRNTGLNIMHRLFVRYFAFGASQKKEP